MNFGVRQGSVLSSFLFNIYLDVIARINDCTKRKFIIVYADNIFLIAESVSELKILLRACEKKSFARHGHQRKEVVLFADRTVLQCGLR